MINPAIETDLVGDMIQVTHHEFDYKHDRWITDVVARGRCRAVTASPGGHVIVWLEVIDEECRQATSDGWSDVAVGDVVNVEVGAERRMRLIRGAS